MILPSMQWTNSLKYEINSNKSYDQVNESFYIVPKSQSTTSYLVIVVFALLRNS
jgi:hypothetical protein